MTGATPENSLDAVRREIDDIDDKILDLLLRRAAATDRVRSAKGAAGTMLSSPLRPSREAQMLRRLLVRAGTRISPESVVRLWRVILSSSVRSQADVSIHLDSVVASDINLRLLIASNFCDFPIVAHVSPVAAIAALRDRSRDLVVFKPDSAWAISEEWSGDLGLKIIGALPALVDTADPRLLIAGCVQSQESGEDQTIVLTKGPLPPDVALQPLWQTQSGPWTSTSVQGYWSADDPEFVTLRRCHPQLELRIVGQLPRSLRVSP